MQELKYKEKLVYKTRPNFRNGISGQASSAEQLQPLITIIMRITRQALNAQASSILISREESLRLSFLFADGPLGERIRRLRISKQSGIAGWVARNGTALIVNDVNQNKYFNKFIDKATGYTTKSMICAPLFINQKVIGIIEVLNKLDDDFSENDLQTLMTAANIVAQVIENLRQPQIGLVLHRIITKSLVSAVDARETSMRGHARRVSEYVLMAATFLSLPKEEKQIIEYAAILHDIGKLGIPDNILNKSSTPTNEQLKMIRKHPLTGFNLLRGIDFLQEASELVLHQNERYDGKGYPHGLKGNAIPMGARLIAVANAFDTMTTEQSYRAALSKKDAFMALRRYAGSKFDPAAVEVFNSSFAKSLLSGKI